MTNNKYSTQVNNKYNDMFINKFEKPSNVIQKRLQKATTVTNDDESQLRANKTGYANLVNEYKKLGITTMPDFNTYDVNDPNYMDKYDPQKALEMQNQALNKQKNDKIWGSLTPAQQYAYTTLASSAKSLGMDVPAIESVDLSNPFWLAKTLNDVNEKISYTNFKGSFDANKAYAFDQFKQEKMYYDDRTRMHDAATWQKMWDDSAQSKLWSDDSFNSQWNTKLTIDRMGNGLWDLGQWGNNGRGGGGGGGGGGGPEGGGPDTPPPPHQFTAADLDTFLRENNIQFSNDPESAYQKTVTDFWTAYGPVMGRTNVRKPSYITAQGNRNPIDFTQTNQTFSSGGGPAKLTPEQQRIVDNWAMKMKEAGDPEYEKFAETIRLAPSKAWDYVKQQDDFESYGYVEPKVNPYGTVGGNVYGGSAYTNQAILDWQNKQRAKFAAGLTGLTYQGINPPAVPTFKTMTEAIAAGMNPYDAAAMFGAYPSGSGKTTLGLNSSSDSTPYDLISTITPVPVKTTIPATATSITNPQGTKTITPEPGGIKRITNGETTIQPTPGTGGGIRPIGKRMENNLRPSNTKKFMGGKSGRMGPLIDDGVGDKGRYFEKGNTRKSQSRNAIKFYETDKTDNVPMSKSFIKALARKIHEINDANYYGNEKPKRSDSIRKDGNFGSSVNLGGTINNYVSPNQRIPSKQMYELDTPRQKTPTPMGASAMKKPMGGSLNAFNPYPRSGSMATGMGSPTMKRMTTHKTITRLSQKSLPQGIPRPPQKVSSKYR